MNRKTDSCGQPLGKMYHVTDSVSSELSIWHCCSWLMDGFCISKSIKFDMFLIIG